MLPLDTVAPSFELPNPITGNNLKLQNCKGEKGTVIMFICNHCPFVKHVNEELVNLTNELMEKNQQSFLMLVVLLLD